jgi:hypothetical protein
MNSLPYRQQRSVENAMVSGTDVAGFHYRLNAAAELVRSWRFLLYLLHSPNRQSLSGRRFNDLFPQFQLERRCYFKCSIVFKGIRSKLVKTNSFGAAVTKTEQPIITLSFIWAYQLETNLLGGRVYQSTLQ